MPYSEGFFLYEKIITPEEELIILEEIKKNPGSKCQQIHPAHEFGWKFIDRHNEHRIISPMAKNDYLGKMPDWIIKLWEKIRTDIKLPKQCLIKDFPDHLKKDPRFLGGSTMQKMGIF